MGKLRKEPRNIPLLTEEEYQTYYNNLKKARSASSNSNVYWDFDKEENGNFIRKAFMHVAEKEGIPVLIRRERGSTTLAFTFKDEDQSRPTRMSAQECQERILEALSASKNPMQKGEIIHVTGISASTWNIRIKELMKEGKVKREGNRRDTKYSLSSG